jgi:hypothetical protein
MITIQLCKHCNNPIPKYRKSYCSPKCLAEDMKSEHIRCLNCGNLFPPVRKTSKYCCLDCFNQSRINKSHSMIEPVVILGARWVSLTQGKFALIDEIDYIDVIQYNWCAVKVRANSRGEVYYAKRTDIPVYLHRYLIDPLVFEEVDHLDGNGLNCRRQNLIPTSRSSNQSNRLVVVNKSSGFKGVHATNSGKWVVRLCKNKVERCLGTYDNAEDAAYIYDNFVRKYKDPSSTYNFPEIGERSAITGEIRK